MFRIAVQSVAHHRRAFLATVIVVFAGTALVSGMGDVLATGLAPGTVGKDRPFLTEFPVIMGSWILGIVLFAIVSTVAVGLDSRREEITGLRLVGAAPAQVQRLVAAESAAVAVLAAIPGIAAGYLVGWLIVDQVRSSGLISAGGVYTPGIFLPVAAAVLVVVATVFGGYLGARTAARRSPVEELGKDARHGRGPRPRRVVSVILIVVGVASSSTSLAMDPKQVYATAATGPGCVFIAVGIALLAEEVLGLANIVLRFIPASSQSASGHLARINLRAAAERTRPVVTFLTLFVGVSAGTLSMQGIENTRSAGNSMETVMASINYMVVGLIGAFMAIALVNNLISSVNHRAAEFSAMALAGATKAQIRRMVMTEAGVAVITSVMAGCAAAVTAVIPFAILKSGNALDALAPAPYLLTVMIGAGLAFGATTLASRKPTRFDSS